MKSAACFCLLLMTSFVGAAPTDPPGSLYHLNVSMQNQRGENHGLDVARGYPVLVTMFYGSCPAACPLIIETLQVIESDLTIADRGQVRVLMISLDPKQDTPEALRDLAKKRRIDEQRWTLARTDEAAVRKIAALLNVQYRRLPDGQYNHANVITVLSAQGEVLARSSVLGRADPALVGALVKSPR